MKKIFLSLILVCLILTGCGKHDEKEVLKEFQNKVNNADSYFLTGEMELVNNEDVYNYNINVSYKKDDFYKIELVNAVNDHKQVILRNTEGVYIVTPSLNKSFKFQSDWPYNNSQVYLLSSLLDDISNDENRTFEDSSEGYIFTSSVNYPNNEKLVNQKVYFGKDYLPKKVEVLDADGNPQITMNFSKIDLRTEFNDTYFDLNSILDTNNMDNTDSKNTNDNTNNNNNNNTTTDNKNLNTEKEKENINKNNNNNNTKQPVKKRPRKKDIEAENNDDIFDDNPKPKKQRQKKPPQEKQEKEPKKRGRKPNPNSKPKKQPKKRRKNLLGEEDEEEEEIPDEEEKEFDRGFDDEMSSSDFPHEAFEDDFESDEFGEMKPNRGKKGGKRKK